MPEASFAEAARYRSWPRSRWIIDGHEIEAHIFRWASAWTGFTMQGDVAVAVAAANVTPDDLRLEALTNTAIYHFDLREPLVYPDSIVRSRRAASVNADEWTEWPRHPDHEALLTGD